MSFSTFFQDRVNKNFLVGTFSFICLLVTPMRHIKLRNQKGDKGICIQQNSNKSSLSFSLGRFTVIGRQGTTIVADNESRMIRRNISHFTKLNRYIAKVRMTGEQRKATKRRRRMNSNHQEDREEHGSQ